MARKENDHGTLLFGQRKERRKRVLNKSSSETLKMVVYPFNATPEVLQDSRNVFAESQKRLLSKKSEDDSSSEKDTVLKEEDISITPGQMGRTHLLTIRGEDVERLEPGEFLNDTIIDFWMKWCVGYLLHAVSLSKIFI